MSPQTCMRDWIREGKLLNCLNGYPVFLECLLHFIPSVSTTLVLTITIRINDCCDGTVFFWGRVLLLVDHHYWALILRYFWFEVTEANFMSSERNCEFLSFYVHLLSNDFTFTFHPFLFVSTIFFALFNRLVYERPYSRNCTLYLVSSQFI